MGFQCVLRVHSCYKQPTENVYVVCKKCLSIMVDPYALLGMTVLMPLLEIVDLVMTFVQKRDVFICDFVAALKLAKGQFYTIYVDKATAFSTDKF